MAPDTYGEVLARNIRAARSRVDIGQENLAARMRFLGFSAWIRQTVGATERGRRRPTAEEIVGLAIALETPAWRLMSPDEDDKPVDLQPEGLKDVPAAYLRGLVIRGKETHRVVWDGDKPAFVSREQIMGAWEEIVQRLTGPASEDGAGDS